MKKYIFTLLFMMLISVASLSGRSFDLMSYENVVAYTSSKVNVMYSQEYIEEQYYLEKIPAEYADAFIYYTRNFKNKSNFRRNFYSIMKHESNNFTAFVHKNADGSIDKGPSQLNSNNIKNPTFRKFYNPKDESHITSVYCFYMVMTINFYYDLVSKYGENYAFYAYNGGEKAIKLVKANENIEDPQPESLLFKVRDYDKKVRIKLAKTNSELDLYINQFKTAKAVEMASEIMSEFYHNEIASSMLDKDINKFGNKRLFYIRREDLAYLEFEEIGIICNSKIGSFDVQTA